MPFPDGVPTTLVQYAAANPVGGGPASGSVEFALTVDAIALADDSVVFTGGGTYSFNDEGSLADGATVGVRLLPNDVPGANPETSSWLVTERITGAPIRSYYIQLSVDQPAADLATIQQIDPDRAQYVAVVGPPGPPGSEANAEAYTDAAVSIAEAAAAADATTKANAAQAAAIAAAATDAATQVATHSADTTAVHGIADTAALVTTTDPRLTNSRTPTAHKTSHASGGSDALTPADIGAYDSASGAALENLRPDLPSEQGLLAWTYDPNMAGHVTAQSNAGVAGRITLVRIIIRKTITWSNVWLGLSGVDAAAVLANCYLGVYDSSGALKGTTADISTSLMSGATAKPLPLATPFTAVPGTYFIAMLLNGTWATNSLTFKASGAGVSTNAGLSAPNLRYSNMLSAQTTLPSSLTLSGQTTTIINTGWASQWYGVS
ncbi:hypothetical protein ACWEAF_05585 [Streptomyces sp. NPDC005071]